MAADVVQATSGNRLMAYANEVMTEMRKVTWPDRAQLKDTTIKIIIFVLFLGAVIGVVDLVLQLVLVRGIPSLFAGH
jgi:preprotein translocase subunit SecE